MGCVGSGNKLQKQRRASELRRVKGKGRVQGGEAGRRGGEKREKGKAPESFKKSFLLPMLSLVFSGSLCSVH